MNLLNKLDFENKIQNMPDRKLIEFIAHQTYEICQAVSKQGDRITSLEGRDKRAYGVAGFLGAIVASIVYFVELWLKK